MYHFHTFISFTNDYILIIRLFPDSIVIKSPPIKIWWPYKINFSSTCSSDRCICMFGARSSECSAYYSINCIVIPFVSCSLWSDRKLRGQHKLLLLLWVQIQQLSNIKNNVYDYSNAWLKTLYIIKDFRTNCTTSTTEPCDHRRPKNVAINFVHCKRRRQRIVYIYINNTLPPALAVHEIYRDIFGPPMMWLN